MLLICHNRDLGLVLGLCPLVWFGIIPSTGVGLDLSAGLGLTVGLVIGYFLMINNMIMQLTSRKP